MPIEWINSLGLGYGEFGDPLIGGGVLQILSRAENATDFLISSR
jgi:hypothetical protein